MISAFIAEVISLKAV